MAPTSPPNSVTFRKGVGRFANLTGSFVNAHFSQAGMTAKNVNSAQQHENRN